MSRFVARLRLRVSHLPVVKDGEAEGLSLRVVAEVCLKAEGLNDRKERLHDEDRRARLGHISCHMASPLAQHRIDGRDAVCKGQRNIAQLSYQLSAAHVQKGSLAICTNGGCPPLR